MPCNLAVSIAKAALSDERLRALLTPQAIQQVVLAYLKQQYAALSPVLVSAQDGSLHYQLGTMDLTIEDGEVTVDTSTINRDRAEQLATQVSALLAACADRLFQQQVQQALTNVTFQSQAVSVSFEGKTQQAAVFHINVNL